MSERRACRLVGLSRSSWREFPIEDELNTELRSKIKEIAHQRRRFGYRRIHDLLRLQGICVNHKRIYRLYSEQNCVFHGNWTLSPRQTGQSERSDAGVVFYTRSLGFVKPLLFFLIDSPVRSSLCALCTSLSRIASAKMGSPIDACQSSTFN
jgi:hypothetical protein